MSTTREIPTTCPICGHPGHFKCKWTPPYKLYHCTYCQTLFCHPLPTGEELNEFYQGFLFKKQDPADFEKSIAEKEAEIKALFPDTHPNGKTFLDHGGGTGAASFAAARLGYKVTYFEIDEEARSFVRTTDQNNVLKICTNPTDTLDQQFDVVYSDNVIEHVPDPTALVGELLTLTVSDGLLIIKTPHGRSKELLKHPIIPISAYLIHVARNNSFGTTLKIARFRPWTFDPPRHLYAFSGDSLKQMAQKNHARHFKVLSYSTKESSVKHLLRQHRNLKGIVFILAALLLEVFGKITVAILRPFTDISKAGLSIHIKKS